MNQKETVWYVCRYTPVEIFTGGFGCEVKKLDPAYASFDCADTCAHPNLCGYGKGVIEDVKRKKLKSLVLTDCCDVMRRVADVLQMEEQIEFIHLLPLPHQDGERDRKRLAASLRELIREWGLYCSLSFDREGFLRSWKENARLEQEERDAVLEKEHITLTGAHAGGSIARLAGDRLPYPVDDRTCTGFRILPPPPETEDEEELLNAYAGALLSQQNACMRMQDRPGYEPHPNAQGVIFHTVKFCDYYGFEYRSVQEKTKVPLLKAESDGTPQGMGQLRTRLDALGELLKEEKGTMAENLSPVSVAAGVDSGSTSTDAVIMNKEGKILGWSILPTGRGAAAEAEAALAKALEMAGLQKKDLDRVVTTGYGRENVGMDGMSITEITCHAKGAHFLNPKVDTVIDIGGQDSKVILLDEKGNVVNFVMNDKCAAGTGRFLEMMAAALEMPLEEFAKAGLKWESDVHISSMCSVFAQSEVVSLVADNTPPADIVHGLNQAVASKTASLAGRLGRQQQEHTYMMTGGVARNEGVVKALEEKLGAPVELSEHAQICGAIGAALIALGKE